LIKTPIKEFSLCWTSFYIYLYDYLDFYGLEFVWTLFEIYDSDVFYFILFEVMIKYLFLNNFVNTHRYPWISVDMKKIDGYPHNGPTDIDTSTRRIFIQQVECGGVTIRTLPAPLTSLILRTRQWHHNNNKVIKMMIIKLFNCSWYFLIL